MKLTRMLPVNCQNLHRNCDGVSPVVGMILILSIVVVSVGIIYASGVPFLDSVKHSTQMENAGKSFIVLNNDIREIVNGPVVAVGMGRVTKVEMGGGTLIVEPNNTKIQINYSSSGNYTAIPGTITFAHRGRSMVYENGGVFSKYNTNSVMEIEPLLYATDLGSDNIAMMVHVVNITGSNSSYGGTGTGQIKTSLTDVGESKFSGDVNNLTITVFSQNNDSWGLYFNETLSNAGLEYGTNYQTTYADEKVSVKISGVGGNGYIRLSIYESEIQAIAG